MVQARRRVSRMVSKGMDMQSGACTCVKEVDLGHEIVVYMALEGGKERDCVVSLSSMSGEQDKTRVGTHGDEYNA